MCVPTADSSSIARDSCLSTECVRTRSTWRAATPALIRTVSRERCVMTTEMTMTSWAMLLALGAFHGINPGMGWLFAVALGMQERRRGAVLRALVPLGAGQALAVAGAVGAVIPIDRLRWPMAAVLISFGVMRCFRHLHPRAAGMRVGMRGLTAWSFLMATAHGAGLMVVPVFVGMSVSSGGGHLHHMAGAAGTTAGAALIATGVHAMSYLAVTAFVALLVFEKFGVGFLRRAWFNVDLLWAGALVATGAVTLMM